MYGANDDDGDDVYGDDDDVYGDGMGLDTNYSNDGASLLWADPKMLCIVLHKVK